ncbi:MAG: hypothetical protein MUC68_00335 [Burkholderiaceae bacterium]|jgi:hypothetical protein|nr:hypothetical protein [Burkholderiaceae bacterium]
MAATRTVRDLLTRSMRVAQILGAGDPMDANDADDALLSVNQMLDAWQAERLYCYAIQEVTHALTAGIGTYTIGPAGTIAIAVRPVRVEYAFTRDATGFDRLCEVVPWEQWSAIAIKGLGNDYPSALYYQPAYPLGSINLWQEPLADLTLHLGVWTQLSEFASLDAVPALPPGYEDAIVFSLAERLCPEYGKEPYAALVKMAQQARANIQQNNLGSPSIGCEFQSVDYRSGLVPAWVYRSGLF